MSNINHFYIGILNKINIPGKEYSVKVTKSGFFSIIYKMYFFRHCVLFLEIFIIWLVHIHDIVCASRSVLTDGCLLLFLFNNYKILLCFCTLYNKHFLIYVYMLYKIIIHKFNSSFSPKRNQKLFT